MKIKLNNKEISWLAFNARVLQEAADPTVPLIERLKFLGIFSSNLDEFFRVRVATLRRLRALGKKAIKLIGHDPHDVLDQIYRIVLAQQADFDEIYNIILKELAAENIYIINEKELNAEQETFVKDYFHQELRPALIPLMIDQIGAFPDLKGHAIYLAVRMLAMKKSAEYKYALIEVPTDSHSRFVILPQIDNRKYIILLDDVIRCSLGDIFSMFKFDQLEAYTIKITRDAELDIDDDIVDSFIRKISKSLKQREKGNPVRFIYDHRIPEKFLSFIIKRLREQKQLENNLIPGGRYHNFKDFINFPKIGSTDFFYKSARPLPHKDIAYNTGMFETIRAKDILLHYPYQTFDYVIDLLREAAIDPHVVFIKITLYRVASQSNVINALINAARNGKAVTVVLELQARFDEEANIRWSQRLQDAKVKVVHSTPGFKVHSKLILIKRKVNRKVTLYANVGTGNFHEGTAKLYSDHALLTCDSRITNEVRKVFDSLENNFNRSTYRHLLVAPFNMRQKLIKLIETEIKNAAKGKEAYIIIKLNNLTDPKLIKKLCEASQAGVYIKLMVRGMFSLLPGVKGSSENIQATATIDRYLEHTRVFVFCHGGNEKYYLASADWMPRNLDRRMEVAAPIYDKALQKEIKDFLDFHLRDNIKARMLTPEFHNQYVSNSTPEKTRAQESLYNYFKEKLKDSTISRTENVVSSSVADEPPEVTDFPGLNV